MSLTDRLDADYAPAWRPEPGEKIIGTVTALDVREGAYGEYPIVSLDTGNGEFAVHAFHEVLRNELAKLAPKVGDRIGVKYVGRHPEHGYHIYKVRRDGDETGFAWSKFGGGDAAPPSDVPAEWPPLSGGTPEPAPANNDDVPWIRR